MDITRMHRNIAVHLNVAAFVSALALVVPVAPLMAQGLPDNDRPVAVTFTKWITANPRMEGVTGGDVTGIFVGEILQFQTRTNPNLLRLMRIEAIYEVRDGNRSFTALIRGGQNASGAALLDGYILDGWRTGAPVHVEFQQTSPAAGGCAEALTTVTSCYEGTIHVGRVPSRSN